MMTQFPYSIRFRLTLWYACVLSLALGMLALIVYLFVVRTLQSNIDQALRSYGQQMYQVARGHVKNRQLNVKAVPVPPLSPHEPIAAMLIMNIHGETKRVTHGPASVGYQELHIALRSGRQSCGSLQVVGGGAVRIAPLRYCTKLIYDRGRPVGGVEVVESLAGVDTALDRLRLALLLGIPFSLVLASGGGWVLAGRALEPVDRITGMARSITATDLSLRINLDRQDELGRLAGTFDDMIARLERAFYEQRRLTADVSHELRSPLTVLEAQTTLALRRARTPDEYRLVLAGVQEEIERMSVMVNQLLTLARADSGEEQVHLEPFALQTVIGPVVEAVRPLAEERGLRLIYDAGEPSWVLGDRDRLHQLMLNLLDNALTHTGPGGVISISIATIAGVPRLQVSDSGEGIAPEDLPHVFERFYRGDRSRNRGTGHSGLGLPIVRWIVEAHGGSIDLRSALGRGTSVDVTLRPAPQPASVSAVS